MKKSEKPEFEDEALEIFYEIDATDCDTVEEQRATICEIISKALETAYTAGRKAQKEADIAILYNLSWEDIDEAIKAIRNQGDVK